MDKMRTVGIKGELRWLNYSMDVMFDMQDKFGNIQKALDIIDQRDREAFEAVRWFLVRMANDGELCRREFGYDPLPMLEEKDITPQMRPLDYALLVEAVVDAIQLGYKREIDNQNEEIDLGLEELRAKKTTAGE